MTMPKTIWLKKGGHAEDKYIEALPVPEATKYHSEAALIEMLENMKLSTSFPHRKTHNAAIDAMIEKVRGM